MPSSENASGMSPETAKQRARVLSDIRAFFAGNGVLEVETPALAHAAAVDCHIDLFTAAPHHGTGAPGFLQTSPELHMKRLLARGYPDIYQICHVFRPHEQGRRHNPEFTMLEWYRHDYSMEQLMDEVARLCLLVLGTHPVAHTSYADLFLTHTGLDPLTAPLDDINTRITRVDASAPRFESRTDALQYLMACGVEPYLPDNTLCFIYHYPAEQAVLALLDPDDPRVARRFELLYNGVELANGWEELMDAAQNRARFMHQNEERRRRDKPTIPLDERFLRALAAGAPACAGVALGLDRLVMLALGAGSIDQVLTFPWDQA